jgi:hypothetical protein
MPVSIATFRKLALALPGAVEMAHFDRPSFRVGASGAKKPKIFATLWEDDRRAVVMLKPEQQEAWEESHPEVFIPVHGTWGIMGATFIELRIADQRLVRRALRMAWEKAAPRDMVKEADSAPPPKRKHTK